MAGWGLRLVPVLPSCKSLLPAGLPPKQYLPALAMASTQASVNVARIAIQGGGSTR